MDKRNYDTFAKTTFLIKLAQDPRVFTRKDGKEDVVLTFADNSRVEGTVEVIWVDARVKSFMNDRAKKYRKGDIMQITGKYRIRLQDDGTIRGKMYEVDVDSFVKTKSEDDPEIPMNEPAKPVFE